MPKSPFWTLVVDESGSPGEREMVVAVVAIPPQVEVPSLGSFHGADAEVNYIQRRGQWLTTPQGSDVHLFVAHGKVPASSAATPYYHMWRLIPLALEHIVARSFPDARATSAAPVHVVVEQVGSISAGSDILVPLKDLPRRLAKRPRWSHVDLRPSIVEKGGHPMLALADLVAHVFFSDRLLSMRKALSERSRTTRLPLDPDTFDRVLRVLEGSDDATTFFRLLLDLPDADLRNFGDVLDLACDDALGHLDGDGWHDLVVTLSSTLKDRPARWAAAELALLRVVERLNRDGALPAAAFAQRYRLFNLLLQLADRRGDVSLGELVAQQWDGLRHGSPHPSRDEADTYALTSASACSNRFGFTEALALLDDSLADRAAPRAETTWAYLRSARAQILAFLGDAGAALEVLPGPDTPGASPEDARRWRVYRAHLLTDLGRIDEALADLGEVLGSQPEHAYALAALGKALASQEAAAVTGEMVSPLLVELHEHFPYDQIAFWRALIHHRRGANGAARGDAAWLRAWYERQPGVADVDGVAFVCRLRALAFLGLTPFARAEAARDAVLVRSAESTRAWVAARWVDRLENYEQALAPLTFNFR